MRNLRFRLSLSLALVVMAGLIVPASSVEQDRFNLEKHYDSLTPAEDTAAKETAKVKKFPNLVACADPGNMPLSNVRLEGFENKIMQVVAAKMNTSVSFFWRPFHQRGLTRETFANKECRIIIGMPTDSSTLLTTVPIYRSTYVFATRNDSGIKVKDLSDPILKQKSVGVFQHSGMREALRRHGIQERLKLHILSYDADLNTEHQPWRQVQQVIDGKLDIAAVWGPFAGFLKTMKGAPITLQPANVLEDETPLEFSISLGMQKTEVVLKYALDNALEAAKDDIEKILHEFGVPLVQCSQCIVQGDLPSHGSYYKGFLKSADKRYLEPLPKDRITLSKAASQDQIVSQDRLDAWLREGADLDQELANAVLASSAERIRFLVKKGANPNKIDMNGAAVLHTAAKDRDSDMVKLLLELGADPNLRDKDGWTPIFHAAFRNHMPSVKHLAAGGADMELLDSNKATPLGLALGARNFYAARALIDAGASMKSRTGAEGVTPLMMVATQQKIFKRAGRIVQGVDPVNIAAQMIEKGADVDAATKSGITALMIAAGHDNAAMIALLFQSGADLGIKSSAGRTALDIAKKALNENAEKSLKLFNSLSKKKSALPTATQNADRSGKL